MTKKPLVSIIIPVKEVNDYIRESLPYLLKQEYPSFEIIILPDFNNKPLPIKSKKIRIIPSGKTGPAEKRDLGAKEARGEILAFIDDDAYPSNLWLKQAVSLFIEDSSLGAVGGPNVTPPNASFFERLSGAVLGSPIVAGHASRRYKPSRAHYSEDLPSVNLLVRKEIFFSIGGFDSHYWPGEDTKLCLDLLKSGKKILYHPEVLVYHHRRKSLRAHLKQIYNYGKHRGYFIKKLPENSLKISYFIPSIFVIGLFAGFIISFFNSLFALVYISSIMFYLVTLLVFALLENNITMVPSFIGVAFLTHAFYGVGLLTGLFKKTLSLNYDENNHHFTYV